MMIASFIGQTHWLTRRQPIVPAPEFGGQWSFAFEICFQSGSRAMQTRLDRLFAYPQHSSRF
jgi:hypothetical protein